MIAAIGFLIILNFLSFGLLFVVLMRIRDLSNNQQGLANRVGVIEEMMVELSEEEESVEEHSFVDLPKESVIVDEAPEALTAEQERTRQVLELARLGLSPETIAKTSGYSNGEVRLILNLHRSGRSIR